jgi:hypothetical protein
MARLKKEDSVFLRDGEGKLIPQEVILESIEDQPTILAIPFVQGDLDLLESQRDNPVEHKKIMKQLICKCCIEPSYTEKDIEDLSGRYLIAIVGAILSLTSKKKQNELIVNKPEGDFLSLTKK